MDRTREIETIREMRSRSLALAEDAARKGWREMAAWFLGRASGCELALEALGEPVAYRDLTHYDPARLRREPRSA